MWKNIALDMELLNKSNIKIDKIFLKLIKK